MTLSPTSPRGHTLGVRGFLAALVLAAPILARAQEAWLPPPPAPPERRAEAGPPAAGGKLYLPELGGELTLDGALAFHFHDDPQRPTLREITAHAGDPEALARIVAERPKDMERLNPQGILARHLEKRRQWDAEDRIPRERRDATLRMVVDTVVELAAGRYSGDFSTQLKTMVADD